MYRFPILKDGKEVLPINTLVGYIFAEVIDVVAFIVVVFNVAAETVFAEIVEQLTLPVTVDTAFNVEPTSVEQFTLLVIVDTPVSVEPTSVEQVIAVAVSVETVNVDNVFE